MVHEFAHCIISVYSLNRSLLHYRLIFENLDTNAKQPIQGSHVKIFIQYKLDIDQSSPAAHLGISNDTSKSPSELPILDEEALSAKSKEWMHHLVTKIYKSCELGGHKKLSEHSAQNE